MAATPFAWRTLQVVALLAAPALLIGGIRLADYAQAQAPRGDGSLRGLILAVSCALSAWPLAAAVTACRRMPVARWIGGTFILALILASLAVLAFVANDRENGMRAVLVAIVMISIIGECGWLYAFALSAQARRYPGG
jgi:hypothetical protein